MNMRALTTLETMEMMVIEAKNELTKCMVIDRMAKRNSLAGKQSVESMNMDGMNRHRMSGMKATIAGLESLIAEEKGREEQLPTDHDIPDVPVIE